VRVSYGQVSEAQTLEKAFLSVSWTGRDAYPTINCMNVMHRPLRTGVPSFSASKIPFAQNQSPLTPKNPMQ
jgi:hypothetical protein